MNIQLIRNATMKIDYAGKTILTDPMLSDKGEIRSFAGLAPNPTIELPVKIEDVLSNVDCTLISHTHPDHFDEAAIKFLPKSLPLFIQPVDNELISKSGFENVNVIENLTDWNGIKVTRTGGKHGSGKILQRMGEVSGFILEAKNEPVVYWVGDSILCDEVKENIKKFDPDIVITHSGGAKIPGFDPIIMEDQQTLEIFNLSAKACVIAIHMESLDHCQVTRKILSEEAAKKEINLERLFIPEDGQILYF